VYGHGSCTSPDYWWLHVSPASLVIETGEVRVSKKLLVFRGKAQLASAHAD
jgi:hypothetical protein